MHYLTTLDYKGKNIIEFVNDNYLNTGIEGIAQQFEVSPNLNPSNNSSVPPSANDAPKFNSPVGKNITPAINFSRILQYSYSSNRVNQIYKDFLSLVDTDKLPTVDPTSFAGQLYENATPLQQAYLRASKELIEKVIDTFSDLFAELIVQSNLSRFKKIKTKIPKKNDVGKQVGFVEKTEILFDIDKKIKTTTAYTTFYNISDFEIIKPALTLGADNFDLAKIKTIEHTPSFFAIRVLKELSEKSFFIATERTPVDSYSLFEKLQQLAYQVTDPAFTDSPLDFIINKNEEIREKIKNSIKEFCLVDQEKFFEGFNYEFIEVDLLSIFNKFINYNYDLPVFELSFSPQGNPFDNLGIFDWLPRFNLSGNKPYPARLDFGVENNVDIILAGLPYVNQVSTKVVSSPPPPPDVYPIPFKNVKDKIKFFINDSYFTYRDYPIKIYELEQAQHDKLLEMEKLSGKEDGKITFIGDEPSAGYLVHRLETYPETYEQFSTGKQFIIENKGGFMDTIESNKKYYYVFRSVDKHFMTSNPSAVYEIEIVENSGAVYPIIKIIDIYKKDSRVKIKSFKNEIKISPNADHILEKLIISESEAINSAIFLNLGKFGSLTPSIFNRNFKIRITSKRSKKKLDINLTFDRSLDEANIKDLIEEKKKKIQQKTKKTKI